MINQQLTSAEVIAELIELAKEVVADGNRGQRFTPLLNEDELAFRDAVSTKPSAVELGGHRADGSDGSAVHDVRNRRSSAGQHALQSNICSKK